MRFAVPGPWFRWGGVRLVVCFAGMAAGWGGFAAAQTCTTQSKLTEAQRAEIGGVAYRLAAAVQANNADAVKSSTIAQFANDFGPTAYVVHATSPALAGDSMAVTQVYLLDASSRSANDASDADFSCPLAGSAAETDFSIGGLPPGKYAFVMVEATGPHPWLLSFLLQAEGGAWKMAGFYPHRLDAAGHDGLWYWIRARRDAKDGNDWLAWLLYGEADELLRPANFVTTTNLDRLRSEQRSIAPSAVTNGISSKNPLVIPGRNGAAFRITSLNSESSEDGKQLNLVVHLEAGPDSDTNAVTARNLAAAAALLVAHPELKSGFDNLWMVAEVPGSNPIVTARSMTDAAQGK